MGIYRLRTDFATHLRVILWVILVIFVVGSLYMFGARPRSMENGGAKDVILTVQKDEVRRSVYDAEWERMFELASANGVKSPLQFANIKGSIVDQIMSYQKTIQIAEEKGVRISKKELRAAMDEKIVENLNANRAAIMGEISKEEQELDPRKDKKYLKTLSDNGMSIDAQIETAKAMIPELGVKAELAQKALVEAAQSKADKLSDKELEDTYNTFKVSCLIMDDRESTKEKAMEAASKAVKDIKGGKSFDEVSKSNKGSFALPDTDYNLIDSPMLPPEVGSAVEKMKVGDVAEPIRTDMGIYIVKLNKIDKKVPAKFDAKAKKERRDTYKEKLGQQAEQELRAAADKIEDFEILDPELAGFYYSYKAYSEMYNPEKQKPYLTKAEQNLEKAADSEKMSAGRDMVMAQLASVKAELGKDKEAAELLHSILDDPESQITDSYDLRMLYGDILVKMKKNADAVKQYEQASELNRMDSYVHEELADKFKNLGEKDKAAAETKKAEDIKAWQEKRMKEYEEAQKKAEEAQKKADKTKADKKKK